MFSPVSDPGHKVMRVVFTLTGAVPRRHHPTAAAAGCQLVASCDLAVAAESAGFAAPGGKGGWFCHTPMVAIARNVGRKRAMELALTGDVMSVSSGQIAATLAADYPEQVWEAIATGNGLTAWFMPTEVEERMGAFYDKKYEDALPLFEQFLKLMPKDGPGELYLTLSRDYAALPPDDWDQVFNLTAK